MWGLPTDQTVFPGRDIVRSYLSQEQFAFSPTGSLIRRDLIVPGKPFYPEKYLHADIAAFFDVMDGVDFGFVHEILMFSREHDETVTVTMCKRNGTPFRDGLLILQEFGPRYFTPDELAALEAKFVRRYYRYLVRNAVLLRSRQFFSYHAQGLRQAGRSPGFGALMRAVTGEMEQAILRPREVVRHIRARLRRNYI